MDVLPLPPSYSSFSPLPIHCPSSILFFLYASSFTNNAPLQFYFSCMLLVHYSSSILLIYTPLPLHCFSSILFYLQTSSSTVFLFHFIHLISLFFYIAPLPNHSSCTPLPLSSPLPPPLPSSIPSTLSSLYIILLSMYNFLPLFAEESCKTVISNISVYTGGQLSFFFQSLDDISLNSSPHKHTSYHTLFLFFYFSGAFKFSSIRFFFLQSVPGT